MVPLDVVGTDEDARHQRVVGDVPSPLWKGENAFSTLSVRRIDSTIRSPSRRSARDLVRLPAFGRTAQRVTYRGPGEAADGRSVSRSPFMSSSSFRSRCLPAGRPEVRRPGLGQPFLSSDSRPAVGERLLQLLQASSPAGTGRTPAERPPPSSAGTPRARPSSPCGSARPTGRDLPAAGALVDLRNSLPASGFDGISQSPWASLARFCLFTRYARKNIADCLSGSAPRSSTSAGLPPAAASGPSAAGTSPS